MATIQQTPFSELNLKQLTLLDPYRKGDFGARMPNDLLGLQGQGCRRPERHHRPGSHYRVRASGPACWQADKLDERIKLPSMKGWWQKLVDSSNALANDLVSPLNEMILVLGAVAKGDLFRTVPMEIDGLKLQGQFLRLAQIVNTIVAQLATFSSEVTREVGTDSKLGGQANVPGAAGTRKNLNDNVNRLATNLNNQARAIAEMATAVTKGNFRPRGAAGRGSMLQHRTTHEEVGGKSCPTLRFSKVVHDGASAIPLLLILCVVAGCQKASEPIKVGVLHSLTGTMAISEKSVRDGTLMAIEEINAKGGVLGRQIQPIVVDGKSDWPTFAAEAERLITKEKVSVIFGCWTSACRKTVKAVFEKHNHLLFYPLQYEGLEQSPNIIYTGAAPNQQIIPAVKWAFDQGRRKFFLVATDYVYPRMANEIIKLQVAALRGQIVGEEYVLLGSKDVRDMVQKIVKTKPDMILNTINGDTNVVFFEALRAAGITPGKIPTISFSIGEEELKSMNPGKMAGDYAVWNYFQSIDSKENREFVRRFKDKYGADRVTDDPIEAGYFGIYLWAQAVKDAGNVDVSAVREAILGQSFTAPGGIVSVDLENQHTWKTVRVGRINEDGQFDIVWSSDKAIRPVPYPVYKSKPEWEKLLGDLYSGWGQNWANQEKK